MAERKFRFLDPESPRRAPDYGSRNMQRKLFALVACLFAVLWCMQQAARPETWQWLVQMDQAAKDRQASERNGLRENDGEQNPATPRDRGEVHPWSDEISFATPPDRPVAYDRDAPPPQLPWELEASFWRLALNRLSPDQHFALVAAFQIWCTELDSVPSADPVLQGTLVKLSNLRTQFDRQIQGLATQSAPGLPPSHEPIPDHELRTTREGETVEASATGAPITAEIGTQDVTKDEDLTAEDETWLDALPDLAASPPTAQVFALPATIERWEAQALVDHSQWLQTTWSKASSHPSQDSVSSLGTLTVAQAVASRDHWRFIREQYLDPILWAAISDGSRLGRPGERAAWLRLVQLSVQDGIGKAVATIDSEPAKPIPLQTVTRQNLMGQPAAFRGQPVRLTGTIRRVEWVTQSDSVVAELMPGARYAVLWLQPGVSGQGPYCVYTPETPELERLAQTPGELRHPATVEGRFFKLHPYLAASGQPTTCPLLLASRIEWRSLSAASPPPALTTGQWLLTVAGIGLVAVGLMAAAWYSTRYRPANPVGSRKRRAAEVRWLQSADVPTPTEALRDLSQQADRADIQLGLGPRQTDWPDSRGGDNDHG